jgi:Fic family protein
VTPSSCAKRGSRDDPREEYLGDAAGLPKASGPGDRHEGTDVRTYEGTHPWLKFNMQLDSASAEVWLLLGEAQSKCEHVAGVPLQPSTAQKVHLMYLAKGVRATTAIEGNTLSQEQVLEHLEGKLELPKSKAYLKQEIDNILRACNTLIAETLLEPRALTPSRICKYNETVLDKLELDASIQPGQIRPYDVGVGTYKAAPHKDCEYLLRRLCDWLNGPQFTPPQKTPERIIVFAILKAIVAHLYLAWIHPFGDGNGRTARFVELEILIGAGVPTPCAHLLSNFYNETRNEYYRQLDYASKSGGDVIPFLTYALQGLADGLRDQITVIRDQQWIVAWVNYVHDQFKGLDTASDRRQKHLVLDLTARNEPVPRSELARVSPRVAEAYANKGPRTLARDLTSLEGKKLLVRTAEGYAANRETILAFLPKRARPPFFPSDVGVVGSPAIERTPATTNM